MQVTNQQIVTNHQVVFILWKLAEDLKEGRRIAK